MKNHHGVTLKEKSQYGHFTQCRGIGLKVIENKLVARAWER